MRARDILRQTTAVEGTVNLVVLTNSNRLLIIEKRVKIELLHVIKEKNLRQVQVLEMESVINVLLGHIKTQIRAIQKDHVKLLL